MRWRTRNRCRSRGILLRLRWRSFSLRWIARGLKGCRCRPPSVAPLTRRTHFYIRSASPLPLRTGLSLQDALTPTSLPLEAAPLRPSGSPDGKPVEIRTARRRGWLAGDTGKFWLMMTPAILGFIIFNVGPMLSSFYLSFTKYDVVSPPRWVGVSNYLYLLRRDPAFWPSVKVT